MRGSTDCLCSPLSLDEAMGEIFLSLCVCGEEFSDQVPADAVEIGQRCYSCEKRLFQALK